jgi:bilirubin oxidase
VQTVLIVPSFRNGQPWPFLDVEPRKYRFRLLDASISRTFRLYFVTSLDIMEDDTARHIPFHVVGSDTGRTSRPVETSDVWLSMAERWEVVFDFAPYAWKPIFLKNFFDTQTDPPFNSTDQVMKFNVGAVVTDATNNGPLPAAFKPLALPPGPADLAHPDHIFDFEHKYPLRTASPHHMTDKPPGRANGRSTAPHSLTSTTAFSPGRRMAPCNSGSS